MPTVTITLTDTPNGAVSIHSSYQPAARLPLSAAQQHALTIIRQTHSLWGVHLDAAPGGVDIDAVHRTRDRVLDNVLDNVLDGVLDGVLDAVATQAEQVKAVAAELQATAQAVAQEQAKVAGVAPREVQSLRAAALAVLAEKQQHSRWIQTV